MEEGSGKRQVLAKESQLQFNEAPSENLFS